MNRIRWHQNENVYWADFRPNYRAPPPAPVAHRGNAAADRLSDEHQALLSCLERRIDSVLLDVLQGQQRILMALCDHDCHLERVREALTPRRTVSMRARPLCAIAVSLSLAACAAIPDTLAQPDLYSRGGSDLICDSEEGKPRPL